MKDGLHQKMESLLRFPQIDSFPDRRSAERMSFKMHSRRSPVKHLGWISLTYIRREIDKKYERLSHFCDFPVLHFCERIPGLRIQLLRRDAKLEVVATSSKPTRFSSIARSEFLDPAAFLFDEAKAQQRILRLRRNAS